jgi:hypothetical protein
MKFCGIDWSDRWLDFELNDEDGAVLAEGRTAPSAEGMAELFTRLEAHGLPSEIGIAIETSHGPWVQALLDRGYWVYPVNPKSADHFRKAMSAAGDKSDSIDRHVLATMLRSCHSALRPLRPDDPAVVSLRIACQDRLRLVEERTAKLNELQAALKTYYPAVLAFFGDLDSGISLSFLTEFPTQREFGRLSAARLRGWLRRRGYNRPDRIESMVSRLSAPVLPVAEHLQAAKANRIVYLARCLIELKAEVSRRDEELGDQFKALPESDWISSLPGVGPTLGPALLACIGRDRNRFEHVSQAQALMGTAPVTKASGKWRCVHVRYACWKFARRTLQWFAEHSRRQCRWAAELYASHRTRGHGHHAALRALAHRWLKIILAMQRTGSRYNEAQFTHSRARYLLNAPGTGM